MKKTLLVLASLLMTLGVMAQSNILWSEDFGNYEANDVPTGGTYNYVCVGSGTKVYNEKLATGEAPELLVGKVSSSVNGSFSATVPMNGVSGEVNLQYKANRAITVSAQNATVGEITNTGSDYSCTVTVPAGTSSVTISFENSTSKNIRLDNIKFFTGASKKAAGLSWGTASREVTIGSDSNNFPTLSNANNLPVTYSSSETSVATIASDGTITLVAAGKTEITASFEGNDEYEAGKATYTLTVKDASSSEGTDISNTPETAYTVAKAIELIAANEGLDTKVYVKGKIASIKEVSTNYGNATYNISDDGTTATTLTVYRGYYLGGEKFTAADQIKVGDEVIVYGQLVLYGTTNEITTGSSIYSLNGTTGISDVTAEKANANAPMYNLAGQRVNGNVKGIVIQNGKKFVK